AVLVVDVDEARLGRRTREGDRRGRAVRAVAVEQAAEVDVDELVAVQGEDVALLPAEGGGEAKPAAAAESLRLLGGDDLGPEPVELPLEQLALAGGTREDHARHARPREPAHLVCGERLPGDLDEGLRPAPRGVAEALGPAAREDDRLQARPRAPPKARPSREARPSRGRDVRFPRRRSRRAAPPPDRAGC